jgi:acyl CoA:acetate/3-ketoacid CoA transferase
MAVTQIVPTARSGDSSKIVTAREAVRLIRSRDTVAISGFGGIGFAEAIIHELAAFISRRTPSRGRLESPGT